MKRIRLWAIAPATLTVILVSGCAAAAPSPVASAIGGVPCAQYTTCVAYSGTSGIDNGAPVAWIAGHPLTADYYANGAVGRFVVAGPVNAITMPVTRLGTVLTIDRSHIIQSAEGCAGSSPVCTEAGFVDDVLLSSVTTGFYDVKTGSITFSAGAKSITFETR